MSGKLEVLFLCTGSSCRSQMAEGRAKALKGVPFDYVVTVCAHANETCPMFPGKAKVVHVGFDDPPALADQAKTEEDATDGCGMRFGRSSRCFSAP